MAYLAELPTKFYSAGMTGFRQESQGEGKDLCCKGIAGWIAFTFFYHLNYICHSLCCYVLNCHNNNTTMATTWQLGQWRRKWQTMRIKPNIREMKAGMEHTAESAAMIVMYHILLRPCSDPAPTCSEVFCHCHIAPTYLWPCSDVSDVFGHCHNVPTLLRPCSDVSDVFSHSVTTITILRPYSDVLVTPSQYYNSGHSLL